MYIFGAKTPSPEDRSRDDVRFAKICWFLTRA